MTLYYEGSLALGLLLGCVVLAKALSAGWIQITLKKPIDVRMSEPDPMDITIADLRRQRVAQHKALRSGYQRGYRL